MLNLNKPSSLFAWCFCKTSNSGATLICNKWYQSNQVFYSLNFWRLEILEIDKGVIFSNNYAERFNFSFIGTTINSKESKSLISLRSMVKNAKFDVENFNGTNNFGMLQCEVMDALF